MNKEIKEILKILKKCEFGACITKHNSRTLLDYITNLQEELKSANESITWWSNRFNAVEKENEFLKLNNPEMNIRHFDMIKENKRKINNLRAENKKLKDSLETMTFTAKIKQEAIDSLITKIDKATEILEQDKTSASFNTAERIAINILKGNKG